MQNPVTPWTATVQADIVNGSMLHEATLSQFKLQIYNAGDSIWLVAIWPDGARIAFRLAFGMNSDFYDATVTDSNGNILISTSTRLGQYEITLSFPETDPAVFRYTTRFKAFYPILIPFWPRDIVPLTLDGKVENTSGIIHTHQVGTRSGHIFFSMTKPKSGTVFFPLILADRIDMMEGVVDDFSKGHVPNIPKEIGLKSEWKYNREEFLFKTAAGILITGAVLMLLFSSDKKTNTE